MMNNGHPDFHTQHSASSTQHPSFCTPPWLSLLCLVLLAGCFAKEPRYPADHARYQKITATVEDLQQAYAKRDASGFRALLLPSALLDRVEVDVAKDFDSFEEITLDISIDRIVIDGDAIDVFVHWQGKWKKKQDEAGSPERGHGVLRFVGMHSILLKSVEGDVPFGMTARKATSESQKSGPS
ncbi:MAG: nuclear transport factor 2 family protein [Nitrospira sp.]|nr:nuclear transport factor 2 family protein [Nitrospira sp.]